MPPPAVSDTVYDLCRPVLNDRELDDEARVDRLEEVLSGEGGLSGRALQDAILGVLWRHREVTNPLSASAAPASPRPWNQQIRGTPSASPSLAAASPLSVGKGSGGYVVPPSLPAGAFAKGHKASPFSSPKPSPSLAFTSPIPHSPSLNNYEFTKERVVSAESAGDYGDFAHDANIDWLVEEDSLLSRPTSSGAGSFGGVAVEGGGQLSGAAPDWVPGGEYSSPQLQYAQLQQQLGGVPQADMSPHDMLRSILGESRSDAEIEAMLEANGYDLSATLAAFMAGETAPGFQEDQGGSSDEKSNSQPIPIGLRPGSSQAKNTTICKYWLQTGSCLRADCRFSHEFGTHICKYWVMGNCLAGDTCVFSHDPAGLLSNMQLSASADTDASGSGKPNFQIQDYDAFPHLSHKQHGNLNSPSSFAGSPRAAILANLRGANSSPRPFGSRPGSRHSSRPTTPSIPPQVDDTDAFPALGAGHGSGKGKKHHGKRGHGHGKDHVANGNAGRMSPSPNPSLLRKGLLKTSRTQPSKENLKSAAAAAIVPPEHVPWVDDGTGKPNAAYVKARQDAYRHGGLRNKFLQSAAQAWNRNDARAAKALSLRGQSENDLMKKAHRDAAKILYEPHKPKRIKPRLEVSNEESEAEEAEKPADEHVESQQELYVDLQGLHQEEACQHLIRILRNHRTRDKPIYAITGQHPAHHHHNHHHAANGTKPMAVPATTKDKTAKAIKTRLLIRNIAFREFSVPGERGGGAVSGAGAGILGIDARTGILDGTEEDVKRWKGQKLKGEADKKEKGEDDTTADDGSGDGDGDGGESDVAGLAPGEKAEAAAVEAEA